MRRVFLLVVCLWLVACSQVSVQSDKPVEPESESEKEPVVEMGIDPALTSRPLKHLQGRTLPPQPIRRLNVRSKCSHRDALGTRTRLNVQVKNAVVKAFETEVNIPKKGICRFKLASFKQVAELPNVLLEAKDGSGCLVRMWEQGPRTTIAFNNCPSFCEGGAFDYLWPVMVESKSGRCF